VRHSHRSSVACAEADARGIRHGFPALWEWPCGRATPSTPQIAAEAAVEEAERNPGVVCLATNAAHARGLLRSDPVALGRAVDLLMKRRQPLATALAQEDLGQVLMKSAHTESAIASFKAAYNQYVLADAHRDVARVRRPLAVWAYKRQRTVPDRTEAGPA